MLTSASKCSGEHAKQTSANVQKRKQTLTPPFIADFYTPPLAIPLLLRLFFDLRKLFYYLLAVFVLRPSLGLVTHSGWLVAISR